MKINYWWKLGNKRILNEANIVSSNSWKCLCTWSIFFAQATCTWQYRLELNPKVHCGVAHFSLQNHTWYSWRVLVNGKKYGSNETFCEGCQGNFWDQVFKVAYMRYIERQSKSMKFEGSKYVCKFGLYALLMEKLPNCLERPISI